MSSFTAEKFFHDAVVKVTRPDVYLKLLRMYNETDVSQNIEFQHLFTWFYRIRRSAEWLDGYYKVFEDFKTRGEVTIKDILVAISNLVHNGRTSLELSFASKMLATMQPDMPIWDSLVRDRLQLQSPPILSDMNSRIDAATEAYNLLIHKTQSLLSDAKIALEIKKIDSLLPEYSHMTAMRKLDFMLWGSNL